MIDVSMTEDMEDESDMPIVDNSTPLKGLHSINHLEHRAEVSSNIPMIDLRVNYQYLPIPLSLKTIITQIFGCPSLQRFSALLNFLTATAPELELVDQQRLASVDITDINGSDIV